MRLGDPQRTMLSGTVLSILLICATPFTGGIFALLFVAQGLSSGSTQVRSPALAASATFVGSTNRSMSPSDEAEVAFVSPCALRV
jgi:predicted lysophospholipase L1 biosynthesis ABC-type transport system permease subunit